MDQRKRNNRKFSQLIWHSHRKKTKQESILYKPTFELIYLAIYDFAHEQDQILYKIKEYIYRKIPTVPTLLFALPYGI